MGNKRVLLISHQADLSGAPLSLFYLAEGLLAGGHYTPIFVVPAKGPLVDKLTKAKIQMVVLQGFKLWSLYRQIRTYQPILLHVNTSVNWQAALLGKLYNIPVIWHIREDLQGHRFLIKFIMKVSSQVIVISKHVRDYFPYSYWSSVSVVYNAVNPKLFKSSQPITGLWQQVKAVFIKDSLASRKAIKIGFVGSIEPRKGVKELIEAVDILKAKFPQIQLQIVGRVLPIAKSYHQNILKFSKKHKLDSTIQWLGKVDAIEDFMRNMDILMVPSLAEPFGRVVIEGMASGTLVIASRCGGIPEIITDKQTGFLVQPGSAEKLSKVMIEVMNMNSSERLNVIKQAKQLVSEKFLMPRQIKEIEQIYADVLIRHA